MEHNLLTSLRKYRPREGKDPLENFITEAFAWILKNDPDFSFYFINKISDKLKLEKVNNEVLCWETQVNFNGVFPDMICKCGTTTFIFEHKAWGNLHENQLDNYRNYAKLKFEHHHLILITANSSQHCQNPDLALCWHDVYSYIEQWCTINEGKTLFIFHDFINLLQYENMGPPAPISHASIISYYSARFFRKSTIELINRILKSKKSKFNLSPPYKFLLNENKLDSWGRIGFSILETWRPGIFVGFLIDGEDHATTPILGDRSPDLSIILDFDKDLHGIYTINEIYKSLVSELSIKIKELDNGFELYNHFEDEEVEEKNLWHPIHIRKPMLEVFKGTTTAEEQEEKFIEHVNMILPIVIDSLNFQALRKQFEIKEFNVKE